MAQLFKYIYNCIQIITNILILHVILQQFLCIGTIIALYYTLNH